MFARWPVASRFRNSVETFSNVPLVVPAQYPSPHKVHMEVLYYLSGLGPAVDGEAVAFFRYTLLSGNLVGCFNHLPDERCLGIAHGGQRCYMFPRNDKQVHRGDGVNIHEGYDILVLIDDFRWYFTVDNLTENAVCFALFGAQNIYSQCRPSFPRKRESSQ